MKSIRAFGQERSILPSGQVFRYALLLRLPCSVKGPMDSQWPQATTGECYGYIDDAIGHHVEQDTNFLGYGPDGLSGEHMDLLASIGTSDSTMDALLVETDGVFRAYSLPSSTSDRDVSQRSVPSFDFSSRAATTGSSFEIGNGPLPTSTQPWTTYHIPSTVQPLYGYSERSPVESWDDSLAVPSLNGIQEGSSHSSWDYKDSLEESGCNMTRQLTNIAELKSPGGEHLITKSLPRKRRHLVRGLHANTPQDVAEQQFGSDQVLFLPHKSDTAYTADNTTEAGRSAVLDSSGSQSQDEVLEGNASSDVVAKRQRLPRIPGGYSCNHPKCKDRQPFSRNGELNKHKRYHGPEAGYPHGCNYCQKRFLDEKDLKRHHDFHFRSLFPTTK